MLVAMVANYGGFLVPKLALVSNILLMVAILMWRPRGLYAVTQPMMILSGDPPRSRALSLILLIVIIVTLALTPLLFPGAKAMNVATKICIFAALVASYDLLLGYTGSVSFAHTMFYGIGSYSVAIALYAMGPNWAAVATGVAVGLPLAIAAGARDRAVLAAGRGDLLCHDHAGGGFRLPGAGLATVVAHRRRGRPQLSAAGTAAARHGADPEKHVRLRTQRPRADLLSDLHCVGAR